MIARPKKLARRCSYNLSNDCIALLRGVAQIEDRTNTAQLERWISEGIERWISEGIERWCTENPSLAIPQLGKF